jgi:antitoxin ParD1/3/4
MLGTGAKTLKVSLTPQLEAKIQERLASGRSVDANEVIGETLQLLEEREKLEHLRSLLAVGLKQARRGELVDFTPAWVEETDRRVEERFLRGEMPNPDVCP